MANSNPYNLGPDEIDKLEKSGHLTPETAMQMRQSPAPVEQPTLVSAGPAPIPEQQSLPGIGEMIGDAASTAKNWLTAPAGTGVENKSFGVAPTETSSPASIDQASVQPEPTDFLPAPQMAKPAPNPLDKHARGIERGYNQQQAAVQSGADAQKNLADETATVLQDHQRNSELIEADRVQREAERQAVYEKEVAGYDDIMKQQLNSKKEDPNRLWNSKTTGQKIMASISLLLGGLAGGGKGNVGLDILNKAIDDDIASQRADIAKLEKVGGMKKTMLGMMREKFGDERQAEIATKAFHTDQTILKLKEVAARSKNPEAQAAADAAIGELEAKKHGLLAQFEVASKAKQVMIGGGQQLPPGLDVESLPQDQRERYVTGVGLATTKEGAKELMKLKATTDSSTEMLTELIGMTNTTGKSINPETIQRAESLSAMLKGQIREGILGPGTVNDSERAILDRLVKNPTAIFSMDNVSRMALKTVMERLQASFNNTAKAHGLRPVSQQVRSFQKR